MEKYEVGEDVLAFNGNRLLHARVLKVESKKKKATYFIHFRGWNSDFDHYVSADYLNKVTEDNLAYKEELDSAHRKGEYIATEVSNKTRKNIPKVEQKIAEALVEQKDEVALKLSKKKWATHLRHLFKMFDLDHSGTIDKNELAAMMKSIGKKPKIDKINSIFDVLDVNGDGELDFGEFEKFFNEAHTETDEQTYCSCQGIAGGRFMLACDGMLDGCFEWYHGDCVGVKSSKNVPPIWWCPKCVKKSPSKHKRQTANGSKKLLGQRLDIGLLAEADKRKTKSGLLGMDDAKRLLKVIMADDDYSDLEKKTVQYLREKIGFTEKADAQFRDNIAKHAIKVGKKTKAAANKKRKREEDDADDAPPAKKGKAAAEKSAAPTPAAAAKEEPSKKKLKKILATEVLNKLTGASSSSTPMSHFHADNEKKFKRELRKVFKYCDKDHSGDLDQEEVKEMMRRLGRRPLGKKVESIFTLLDNDGNGRISFEEFVKYFTSADTVPDETCYCTCRKPADGRFMVACDASYKGCHEWFHGECVDVKEDSEDTEGLWFCPSCIEQVGKKIENSGKTSTEDKKALVRSKSDSSAVYQGNKFDSDMVTIAADAVSDHKEITLTDAKKLVEDVLADGQYSKLEKDTIRYLRKSYKWSEEADTWYRQHIASWASQKGHAEREDRRRAEMQQRTEAQQAALAARVTTRKQALDQWFANHPMPAISTLAPQIAQLTLYAILPISRQDWFTLVGCNLLAAASVIDRINQEIVAMATPVTTPAASASAPAAAASSK